MRAGGTVAGSLTKPLFLHRRAMRQGDDAANTLYAGLPEEPEPLYGGACGYGAGSLQYAAAQRNAADGLVCTEPPETGMAGISGYLGTLCHIKRSPSALAEGLLFLMVRKHLSVSFADSSPQGEPSPCLPLRGGGMAQP